MYIPNPIRKQKPFSSLQYVHILYVQTEDPDPCFIVNLQEITRIQRLMDSAVAVTILLTVVASATVALALARVSPDHDDLRLVNGHTLGRRTSTRQAYLYRVGAGVSNSENAGDTFGYVGLSFSILPFLPPDQNITFALTHSKLWVGEWRVPPEQNLYPVGSKIGNSLMGFKAVGNGAASPDTLRVNGTVTYQWTSNDTQTHKLSLFFNSYANTASIHTEWYVPGYEATTLGVGIGEDLAYSIIYAAGDSPPVPP